MKLAVVSSVQTTFINNDFRNEVSVVDVEVDRLSAKLEQDGTLGRFMMSIDSCDCKTEKHVDDASVGAAHASMTDDSHTEVEDLDDFDTSDFDSEEILNEYFTSSACVRSKNRIDGKYLSKCWKIDRRC